MELGGYPRHSKRCINGFKASSRLFAASGRTASSVLAHPRLANRPLPSSPAIDKHTTFRQSVAPPSLMQRAIEPALSQGRLARLADQICQEASLVQSPSISIVVTDPSDKIVQINSCLGEKIALQYTPEGVLRSFTRLTPQGKVHSAGLLEKHSVIIRDSCGNLKALGESMSVSRCGCLTVHQFDGQFLRIDFDKQIQVERRYIESRSGLTYSLTAYFAQDGFRYMTVFQSVCSNDGRQDAVARHAQISFRFYGRDGSVIEFSAEDKIKSRKPSCVKPAANPVYALTKIACRPQRTSWDSVNFYLGETK